MMIFNRGEDSTIDEPSNIDLLEDAKSLKKAMKGWGTDENTLIEILTHRTYNNRLVINSAKKFSWIRFRQMCDTCVTCLRLNFCDPVALWRRFVWDFLCSQFKLIVCLLLQYIGNIKHCDSIIGMSRSIRSRPAVPNENITVNSSHGHFHKRNRQILSNPTHFIFTAFPFRDKVWHGPKFQ